VPVAVLVHAPYLRQEARRAAVAAFLRWALAQPHTWAVTYRQYVEWLRAGSPSGDRQVGRRRLHRTRGTSSCDACLPGCRLGRSVGV
jgi:hypothetical protein